MVCQSLADLLFPPVCCLCNEPVAEPGFCVPCLTRLTLSQTQMESACRRCGIPRPVAAGVDPNASPRCVHCRDKDYQFDEVIPLWSYQDSVCDAVVAAKFASRASLGDELGRRLAERVRMRLGKESPDDVTYIPSHFTRQIHRGGSGNQVIATRLARVLGSRCLSALRLTRRIAKQAWLDDQQRLENVRGAFSLKKSYALLRPQRIANQHILLVDDVLTTGATANEVARVLRENGARRVTLAVVARALRS